jgi:hypothetical protein
MDIDEYIADLQKDKTADQATDSAKNTAIQSQKQV